MNRKASWPVHGCREATEGIIAPSSGWDRFILARRALDVSRPVQEFFKSRGTGRANGANVTVAAVRRNPNAQAACRKPESD
ncbi:MAG: hypothetical protein K0U79_09605 [Gammaproteobacteria bacterium]|nr:hypothetical protein [Gammaproteobacteria bacterium]